MNPSEVKLVLQGATAMGYFVAGLFFVRFWRDTADRLFAMFALAFWALAVNSGMLATVHSNNETQHQLYLIRLVAFVLIIAGVVDKNRTDGRS
jgi:hypothetical protein